MPCRPTRQAVAGRSIRLRRAVVGGAAAFRRGAVGGLGLRPSRRRRRSGASAGCSGRLVHLQRGAADADAHRRCGDLRPVDGARRARDVQGGSSSTCGPGMATVPSTWERMVRSRSTWIIRGGWSIRDFTSWSSTSATSRRPSRVTGVSCASRRLACTPRRSSISIVRSGRRTSSRGWTTSRSSRRGRLIDALSGIHRTGPTARTRPRTPASRSLCRSPPSTAAPTASPHGAAASTSTAPAATTSKCPGATPGSDTTRSPFAVVADRLAQRDGTWRALSCAAVPGPQAAASPPGAAARRSGQEVQARRGDGDPWPITCSRGSRAPPRRLLAPPRRRRDAPCPDPIRGEAGMFVTKAITAATTSCARCSTTPSSRRCWPRSPISPATWRCCATSYAPIRR